jgi:hypothetical protein
VLTPLHDSVRRWALVLALLAAVGAAVAGVTSAHAASEPPALGMSDEHAQTCLLLSLVCSVAGAFAIQAARSRRRARPHGPRVALTVGLPRPSGRTRTLAIARAPSPPDLCRFLT